MRLKGAPRSTVKTLASAPTNLVPKTGVPPITFKKKTRNKNKTKPKTRPIPPFVMFPTFSPTKARPPPVTCSPNTNSHPALLSTSANHTPVMRTRPIPAADPNLSRMLKWASHPDTSDPSHLQHLPDGPRSLPTRRLRHPEISEPSYSSIALAASDDPRVAATLSLPDRPPLSHDARRLPIPITPRHHSLHHHDHLRRLRSHRPEDTNQPSITRSDSLLNRARRVFSLPTSLKRRGPRPFPPSDTASVAQDRERLTAFSYRRRPRHTVEPSPSFPTTSRRNNTSFHETTSSQLDHQNQPRDLNEAEARIRVLESQLEAERIRTGRLRKKIDKLEEEGALNRQALPAVETIIKSALSQFEAKETALKHTISKIDQEYSAVLAEKNEAVRLLNAFVGRSGRSPPASFSSVSEAGTEVYNRDSRRVLSMDAFRRPRVAGVVPDSSGSSIASNSGSFQSKQS